MPGFSRRKRSLLIVHDAYFQDETLDGLAHLLDGSANFQLARRIAGLAVTYIHAFKNGKRPGKFHANQARNQSVQKSAMNDHAFETGGPGKIRVCVNRREIARKL